VKIWKEIVVAFISAVILLFIIKVAIRGRSRPAARRKGDLRAAPPVTLLRRPPLVAVGSEPNVER
jgi:hypothetical protein